ncbi:hypothetical protein TNCV_2470001 [Trichonephila clavipes]|nr:hypothetical protein TNCV_2470001 [Trichonephila clavipes]
MPPGTWWGYNNIDYSPNEKETEHMDLRSLSFIWLLDFSKRLAPRRKEARDFKEELETRGSYTRCLTSHCNGYNREEPGPLFGPHHLDATENEVQGANFWGPPIRDDEGRVVDLPLEFKKVNSRRERKKEKRND